MPCHFWLSIAFLFYFYLVFESIFIIKTQCLILGFIFISMIFLVMFLFNYLLLYLDMRYFQHALSFWLSTAFLFYFYLVFESIFIIKTQCLFSGFIFISLIPLVMILFKFLLLYLDMRYFQHALSFLAFCSLSFLFLPCILIDFH